MTRSMNDVLARHYSQVRASLGRDRSRVLHATGAITPAQSGASGSKGCDSSRSGPESTAAAHQGDADGGIDGSTAGRWPRRNTVATPGGDLEIWHHGGVFAAGRLDPGTRLLLQAMHSEQLPAGRAHDLGAGAGVISVWLARRGLQVSASDISRLAIESTRASAEANGVQVATRLAAGAVGVAGQGLSQVDLLVSNPPFHTGQAKDSTPTLEWIGALGSLVHSEAWLVWNSHLPYLRALRVVGHTEIIARDRSYTVTRTRP